VLELPIDELTFWLVEVVEYQRAVHKAQRDAEAKQ
jgi:hypothetical protein